MVFIATCFAVAETVVSMKSEYSWGDSLVSTFNEFMARPEVWGHLGGLKLLAVVGNFAGSNGGWEIAQIRNPSDDYLQVVKDVSG